VSDEPILHAAVRPVGPSETDLAINLNEALVPVQLVEDPPLSLAALQYVVSRAGALPEQFDFLLGQFQKGQHVESVIMGRAQDLLKPVFFARSLLAWVLNQADPLVRQEFKHEVGMDSDAGRVYWSRLVLVWEVFGPEGEACLASPLSFSHYLAAAQAAVRIPESGDLTDLTNPTDPTDLRRSGKTPRSYDPAPARAIVQRAESEHLNVAEVKQLVVAAPGRAQATPEERIVERLVRLLQQHPPELVEEAVAEWRRRQEEA